MAKNTARSRNGFSQVTNEQIASMANTGVSDASVDLNVAERSGSDDKVGAAQAEGQKPKVATFTPDGRAWIEKDEFGLRTAGLYGQRGRFALRHEDLQRHAQFRGEPLSAEYLETVIHGTDPSAPESFLDTVSGETLTKFVRTAMINTEGDLMRDAEGNVVYRGQFVITGNPLAVHAAATGNNLYKLRDARNRRKSLPNGREVADLLPSQSFDQANARLAGIQGHFSAKAVETQAFQERLGYTMKDARTNREFDRGSFAPKTPRGQRRNQPRRWTESTDAE